MSKYRKHLPQLKDQLFMTDGGLETTLIYHEGIDLPYFAAFDLLKNEAGIEVLRKYYVRYTEMARSHGLGVILEAPTWRANPDWAAKLGYDTLALADANRKAIGLLLEVRTALETAQTKVVISGNLGPRGDGYIAGKQMTARAAQDYHAPQIQTFAATDADLVSAFTMNYVEEAIGIVRAAREARMPVVISFTLETDGNLPSGQTLHDAIAATDAATDGYAAYYMINCAHPTHFRQSLQDDSNDSTWLNRIRGVRANASYKSHAELDASTELDAGNPQELGMQYRELQATLNGLAVVGGCCGTDHRHVDAMCRELCREPAEV